MNLKNIIFQLPAFLVLAIVFAVTACGDSSTGANDNDNGNGNGNGNGGNEPAANEVWMEGTSFTPSNREVEAGTRVTWINKSSMVHTVTSGEDGDHDGLFDSGNMSSGDEYSYTFDDEGTYEYFCRPHVGQGMTGTITVTSGD